MITTINRSWRVPSDAFERGGHRAHAIETQRRKPVAALATLKLVEQRRHDAGAAGADRAADRDRTARPAGDPRPDPWVPDRPVRLTSCES